MVETPPRAPVGARGIHLKASSAETLEATAQAGGSEALSGQRDP